QKKQALGDRLGKAAFTSWNTLTLEGTGTPGNRKPEEIGVIDSYKIYAFDAAYQSAPSDQKASMKESYLVKSGNGGSNKLEIQFDEEIKPYLSYTIETKMADDPSRTKTKIASFNALYDTETFQTKYTYTGNDLGFREVDGKAQFKLWAPTASFVQVRIYFLGTPGDLFATYQPVNNWGKSYDMELGKQGVWQVQLNQDLTDPELPIFYTYYVTNPSGTIEAGDPYAESTGLNGVRSAIIDWASLDKPENAPEKWAELTAGTLLPELHTPNELSVYEVHIRDLTIDETWNGKERPGTYKAFMEKGTTYSGKTQEGEDITVKTGFDHIVEMGVNAIQILPMFDQDNDERWTDKDGNLVTSVDEAKNAVNPPSYNWGYNPYNFNSVEGAYSSNPMDGITKVKEFRELVAAYAREGIRVIMDVVYNHVASINGSNFTKIVPGYYLRTNEDGTYFDGTGVGNVTASERPMMRKFIVDSVKFWATRYNVKGYRFDLMGCIDTQTMREVKDALYEIDPEIVVYGEGWSGFGGPGLKAPFDACSTENVYSQLGDNGKGSVGCFNDRFRDGVKGNTGWGSVSPDWGFVSKGPNDLNNEIKARVAEGMIGANVDNKNSIRGMDPAQAVNYVACHDNYGLYDQLNYCINYLDGNGKKADIDDTTGEVFRAVVASQASCYLNQGIAFTNGGDEIFRQKVMKPDDPLFPKMVKSYIGRGEGHDYEEGDGIEMASGNWLVRNSYQYGDEVNSYKWDRKATYYSYYSKIQEASLLRQEILGNILGRTYSEIKDRKANNVFGTTYENEHGPMVAVYLQGKLDAADYYLCFAGRADTDWTDLGCGNCDIEVLYSSTGVHESGQKFSITNGKLGAGKYEVLLVRASR
ncbi:MAG: alpha-amylase family glycosyl hydrolase, partial [Candidatus Enteromonas sp.]|nr:alpha-amylase family glycosyl hydrolase [Candidatus Enteromonas sp.]